MPQALGLLAQLQSVVIQSPLADDSDDDTDSEAAGLTALGSQIVCLTKLTSLEITGQRSLMRHLPMEITALQRFDLQVPCMSAMLLCMAWLLTSCKK